jgi:hypothetical protein
VDGLLYLDTARLGRMSLGAYRASADYLALVGCEGGSAYFGRFLRGGLASCPDPMADRYPGLRSWNGIAALKQSLRRLAGSRPDLPVLVAARSAQLMKLAARLLFQRCRRILAVDLGWPGYHAILAAEGHRLAREVRGGCTPRADPDGKGNRGRSRGVDVPGVRHSRVRRVVPTGGE